MILTCESIEYFKWLLTANADYIEASDEIREFVEKVIWQVEEKYKLELEQSCKNPK